MAARFFRYEVINKIKWGTLHLVAEHKCWGEYTPDWEPTQAIPPMATGGAQAESDGFMTGTSGWLKYRIKVDSDGRNAGMLYLPWSNPYFGATWWNPLLVANDAKAHCDADAPGGAEGFDDTKPENAAPSGLDMKISTALNGEPWVVDDWTEVWKMGIPAVAIIVPGTAGIYERAEVRIELTSDSSGTTIPFPTGVRTRSLDKNPSPSTLNGEWTTDHIRIRMEYLGFLRSYRVHIADSTPGCPLDLTTYCSLGAQGIEMKLSDQSSVLRSMVTTGVVAGSAEEVGRASVALSASTAALAVTSSTASPENRLGLATSQKIKPNDIVKIAKSLSVSRSAELTKLSRTISALLSDADYTLHPSVTTSLQLFRELLDGSLVGYSLHYVRLDESGRVLSTKFLIPTLNIA